MPLSSVRSSPRAVTDDLTHRLFSLSSSGRLDHWSVAWDATKEHPILGTGAGSYEQEWVAHRPKPGKVRDAHSLYVETASDLGFVGLLILAFIVVVPLVASVRARSHPIVPVAAAGFVAYLTHAAVDWDWEMPFLKTPLLHDDDRGLTAWLDRHNRYATWEAHLYRRFRNEPIGVGFIGFLRLDPFRRKRVLRRLWVRMPFRPLVRFLVWYGPRRGFLDGRPGFTFCVLMAYYELVIGLKLRELERGMPR